MADVLIKGMEMPIDGDYIFSFASDEKENICRIEKVSRDGSGTPIQYRMVVELPTHGRLIDADALMLAILDDQVEQSELAEVYDEDYHVVLDWLRVAPTVIEASEDGEQDG